MTKRRVQPKEGPTGPPRLTVPRPEASQKIQARIKEGETLLTLPIDGEQGLRELKEAKNSWSDYNRDLLLTLFDHDAIADEYYASHGVAFSAIATFSQKVGYVQDGIKNLVARLRSILGRLELYEEMPSKSLAVSGSKQHQRTGRKVFIVHGHDESLKQSVARLVGAVELEPIILHEQPNAGRTIIEKFEEHSDVEYAIVLLTPDDEGHLKKEPKSALKDRARQNVILELGYFIGKLGRDRVCAVYVDGVELPGDMSGVLYTPFDEAGSWKYRLAREMQTAGLPIDLNKVV